MVTKEEAAKILGREPTDKDEPLGSLVGATSSSKEKSKEKGK